MQVHQAACELVRYVPGNVLSKLVLLLVLLLNQVPQALPCPIHDY